MPNPAVYFLGSSMLLNWDWEMGWSDQICGLAWRKLNIWNSGVLYNPVCLPSGLHLLWEKWLLFDTIISWSGSSGLKLPENTRSPSGGLAEWTDAMLKMMMTRTEGGWRRNMMRASCSPTAGKLLVQLWHFIFHSFQWRLNSNLQRSEPPHLKGRCRAKAKLHNLQEL